MGFGGISIWQLLIVLAIVVLIFGTKRLKNLGGDLGSAMKSFRSAMGTDDEEEEEERKRSREERESLGSDPDDVKPGRDSEAKTESKDSHHS